MKTISNQEKQEMSNPKINVRMIIRIIMPSVFFLLLNFIGMVFIREKSILESILLTIKIAIVSGSLSFVAWYSGYRKRVFTNQQAKLIQENQIEKALYNLQHYKQGIMKSYQHINDFNEYACYLLLHDFQRGEDFKSQHQESFDNLCRNPILYFAYLNIQVYEMKTVRKVSLVGF